MVHFKGKYANSQSTVEQGCDGYDVCFVHKSSLMISLIVQIEPRILNHGLSKSQNLRKTRNKMRVAIESGKGMKVKVVKLR